MRTITALAALLLLAPAACDGTQAPSPHAEAKAEQEANGDDVKVLGFTFGKPPPEEAVLKFTAGRYRNYELKHRWCDELTALTDNGRVVSASCHSKHPATMRSLLKSRYGPPQERGELSIWFTPYGTAISKADGVLYPFQWLRATTLDELYAAAKAAYKGSQALVRATESAIVAEISEAENAEGEDF